MVVPNFTDNNKMEEIVDEQSDNEQEQETTSWRISGTFNDTWDFLLYQKKDKAVKEPVSPENAECLLSQIDFDSLECKADTPNCSPDVEMIAIEQATRSLDVGQMEQILEIAALMEFRTTSMQCPISSCGASVTWSNALAHMLNSHCVVMCHEISFRDIATFKVYLHKLELGETYCAGLIAFYGEDSMGPGRPANLGLCNYNADLPAIFERIDCHLPIMLMVSKTTLNAVMGIKSPGCEAFNINGSNSHEVNNEKLLPHTLDQAMPIDPKEENNGNLLTGFTDPKMDENYEWLSQNTEPEQNMVEELVSVSTEPKQNNNRKHISESNEAVQKIIEELFSVATEPKGDNNVDVLSEFTESEQKINEQSTELKLENNEFLLYTSEPSDQKNAKLTNQQMHEYTQADDNNMTSLISARFDKINLKNNDKMPSESTELDQQSNDEVHSESTGPKQDKPEEKKKQSDIVDNSETVLLVWLTTVETLRPVVGIINVFSKTLNGSNYRSVVAYTLKDGNDPTKFSPIDPQVLCIDSKDQTKLLEGQDSTLVDIEVMITAI